MGFVRFSNLVRNRGKLGTKYCLTRKEEERQSCPEYNVTNDTEDVQEDQNSAHFNLASDSRDSKLEDASVFFL